MYVILGCCAGFLVFYFSFIDNGSPLLRIGGVMAVLASIIRGRGILWCGRGVVFLRENQFCRARRKYFHDRSGVCN